jgi:hypothetical protein
MDAILRGKAEELAKEIAVSIFKSTTIRRGFWCIPHLQPNERRRVFRKEDDRILFRRVGTDKPPLGWPSRLRCAEVRCV